MQIAHKQSVQSIVILINLEIQDANGTPECWVTTISVISLLVYALGQLDRAWKHLEYVRDRSRVWHLVHEDQFSTLNIECQILNPVQCFSSLGNIRGKRWKTPKLLVFAHSAKQLANFAHRRGLGISVTNQAEKYCEIHRARR
jgi:hypothetical protein